MRSVAIGVLLPKWAPLYREHANDVICVDATPRKPSMRSSDDDALYSADDLFSRGRSNSVVFSGMPLLQQEDLRDGTLFSSVITLSMSAAGAGILALPSTLKSAGLIGGVLTLLLSAWVSDHSCVLLAKANARYDPHDQLGLAKERAANKKASRPLVLTVNVRSCFRLIHLLLINSNWCLLLPLY